MLADCPIKGALFEGGGFFGVGVLGAEGVEEALGGLGAGEFLLKFGSAKECGGGGGVGGIVGDDSQPCSGGGFELVLGFEGAGFEGEELDGGVAGGGGELGVDLLQNGVKLA